MKSKQQASYSMSKSTPTQSTLNLTFSKTNCVGNFFEIDETNKLWRLPSSYPQIFFSYTDLLTYEVIKNGTSITRGGLGRAVVGGALFGGVGAVVGGVTGKKKTKTKVTEHKIKITLKNSQLPVVYINLLPFGSDYTADQITAHLAQMIKEVEAAATSNVIQSASISAADEITKLKQLMDDGIITEQEFEAKKKQLLNTQEQQHNQLYQPLQQVNTIPTRICKHCHANMPLNDIRCPQCRKKQRSSAPILIVLLLVILPLFLIVAIGVNSTNNVSNSHNTTPPLEILDCSAFSRISIEELLEKLGEPKKVDDWNNKTSKGEFQMQIYSYDFDDFYAEFITYENNVVKLRLFSNSKWKNEGSELKDVFSMFGILPDKNLKKTVDTGRTYKFSPVSDKVAEFAFFDYDKKDDTFSIVYVTYNLNYFD